MIDELMGHKFRNYFDSKIVRKYLAKISVIPRILHIARNCTAFGMLLPVSQVLYAAGLVGIPIPVSLSQISCCEYFRFFRYAANMFPILSISDLFLSVGYSPHVCESNILHRADKINRKIKYN